MVTKKVGLLLLKSVGIQVRGREALNEDRPLAIDFSFHRAYTATCCWMLLCVYNIADECRYL